MKNVKTKFRVSQQLQKEFKILITFTKTVNLTHNTLYETLKGSLSFKPINCHWSITNRNSKFFLQLSFKEIFIKWLSVLSWEKLICVSLFQLNPVCKILFSVIKLFKKYGYNFNKTRLFLSISRHLD
jgi:hypothetical protein